MPKDRHTIQIACPDCHSKGQARVADNDGWSFMNSGNERSVDAVTDGFVIVEEGGSWSKRPVVHCDCGGNVDVGH